VFSTPALGTALTRPVSTVTAIERQIVLRLAQFRGCDPVELERELRLADRDMPLDAPEARLIVGSLEDDFYVSLIDDNALDASLEYGRELAILIQRRMIASACSEPTVTAGASR
jgi:hypothetical protein